MGYSLDITGRKFGKLTAIRCVGVDESHHRLWLFKCDCGKETVKVASNVKNGSTRSCGCLFGQTHKTHGQSRTRLYETWENMKTRSGNEKYGHYAGISVCDEWLSFQNFYEWAISNGYRDDLTIDRIDNEGNYEPNNCRWVDRKVQANNTSRNRYMTYKGVTKTLTGWSEYLNTYRQYIYFYLDKGMSDEEVIEHFLRKKETKCQKHISQNRKN